MGRRCCCGCPACTVDTRLPICRPCVCLALCVTLTPNAWDAYEAENRPACEADDQVCRPQSVEIDWDEYEQAYIGSIAGHDLYYSFYRNDYDGKCYFYLESESLGRHEWEVKETDDQCYGREHECVTCLDLTTALGVEGEPYDECSAGTLTTECVNWITPTTCNTCACLCECVCANLSLDGIDYTGKACWDDYQNMYTGEVYGRDLYNVCRSRTVKFPIDRWGDVCDPNVPEDDPTACEPIHVLDDTDYTCEFTGEWSTDSLQGYGGSMRYAEAGAGSKKVEWTFTGLPKGRWRVSATWVAGDGRASNAPYTILDGTRMAGFVRLNQSNAPDDFTYGGTGWERLGTFTIKGDTLTVRLTDAANGAVYADAIHLEYIDDRCAIGLMISADVGEEGEVNGWIHGNWQKMAEPCELRAVNYSWHIERDTETDDDDIEVTIRCATCNEDCEPYVEMPCCDNPWPKRLTLSCSSNSTDFACLCEYPQTFPLQWSPSEGWLVTGIWNCPNSELVMADCPTHGVFLTMAPSSCDIVVFWAYGIPPEDPYNIATWGTIPYSLSPSFGNLLVITDDTTLAAAMAQLEAELEAAGRKFDTHGVLVCDPPMIWIRKREHDTEEWRGVDIIVTA